MKAMFKTLNFKFILATAMQKIYVLLLFNDQCVFQYIGVSRTLASSSTLEELEQLEKTERASDACRELLSIVESRPDPLLPVTYGPANPIWDRWFEGPQDSQGCRCWIL
ncbi:guanine nucleotide-binding protein subunit gamma 1 isoform X1 [Vitis riparia]|uniref:guanine nucleotide-binding protein subunit gamma 1 isoform X1 n=1 Tax=Vitis riparia TaxID=96939 RepID=UPI00155A3FB9|nr:guanine nucleotide-binding protein subunit gamma 1 isoform X1 [Vitis riparia]